MNKNFNSTVVSGEEFNKIFPEVIKFTNAAANHRGVNFEVGKIVTDPLPWSDKECLPGGIYFTVETHMKEWYDMYGHDIGKICRAFAVSVRPDAKVAVYRTKAKATSIEILRELDYDLLVGDLVREKERERKEEEKRRMEEEKRRMEEEKRRMEEEKRRMEEEKRRMEEEKRNRQPRVDELRQHGVEFHKSLDPATTENLITELVSDEMYPLALELAKEKDHDINEVKFDKIYRVVSKALLGKLKYRDLKFAPFLSPRLLHVANLEFKRYSLSYCFENDEIKLMDLYPNFFSNQPYANGLADRLSYSYLHISRKQFPNIQKALGMI
jgi:hypothetical protein